MKKFLVLCMVILVSACSSSPKETYPYGMTEAEWNQLSIKDKTKIRRDFYFYEKGQVNFVNPDMDIEGRKEMPNVYQRKAPAAKKVSVKETVAE